MKLNASQKTVYPAGSIRLTVPKTLLTSWDDEHPENVNYSFWEYSDQLHWQIPEAPGTSTSSSFNYQDNSDGTCTVSNYTDVHGGTDFSFEQAFRFRPSHVQVDGDGNATANYAISLHIDPVGGAPAYDQQKSLTFKLHNENRNFVSAENGTGLPMITMEQTDLSGENGVFFDWQTAWGPKPADAEDYFYAIWHTDICSPKSNCIPFTYTVDKELSIPNDHSEGELVGLIQYNQRNSTLKKLEPWFWRNDFSGFTDSSYKGIANTGWEERKSGNGLSPIALPEYNKNYYSAICYDLHTGHKNRFAMLVRYPMTLWDEAKKQGRDPYKDGIAISNKASVQMHQQNGVDQEPQTVQKSIQVHLPPVGYLGLTKVDAHRPIEGLFPFRAALSLLANEQEAQLLSNRRPTYATNARVRPQVEPTWDAETQSYQAKSYTTTIEEGQNYLLSSIDTASVYRNGIQNNPVPLGDEDLTYQSVTIACAGRDGKKTAAGNWVLLSTPASDPSRCDEVQIYTRAKGAMEYVLYGTMHLSKNNSGKLDYTFEDNAGNRTKGSTVTLPKDTVGLKYQFTSTFFQTDFYAETTVVLHPSPRLQKEAKDAEQKHAYGQDISENNTHKGCYRYLSSDARMEVVTDGVSTKKTVDTKNQLTRVSTVQLEPLSFSTVTTKEVDGAVTTDKDENQTKQVKMCFGQRTSALTQGFNDASFYKDYVWFSGEIYDLLPAGVAVDPEQVNFYLCSYSQLRKDLPFPRTWYTVDFKENWENSGQTMMIIKYDIPEKELPEDWYKDGEFVFYVCYPMVNSRTNIIDRGNSVLNTVAFHNTSGINTCDESKNFTNSKYTKAPYYQNLINDSSYNKEDWKIAECTVGYDPATVLEAGGAKKVANDHTKTYDTMTKTYLGNAYSYQLSYTNAGDTHADSLVFYDVLENGFRTEQSQWKGTLDWVDLNSIRQKQDVNDANAHCEPVLYYAITVPDVEHLDVDDSAVWKEFTGTSEEWKALNKTDIKAIAVDCRKTDKGQPFTLEKKMMLSAYVHMVAPKDATYAEKKAVNPVHISRRIFADKTAPAGSQASFVETSAKIQLLAPDLSLTKSSDPVTGTKAKPCEVKNEQGTPITYTLTVKNEGKELPVRHLALDDVIPAGLTVDVEKIRVTTSAKNDADSAFRVTDAKLSESPVRLMQDATNSNHLTFTITMPNESEVTLTIPTTVAAKVTKTTDLINTAKILAQGDVANEIVSDTMYHRLTFIPPTRGINVSKLWKGPTGQSITAPAVDVNVELLQNGKPMSPRRTLTLNAAGSWQGSFKDIPVSGVNGQAYAYTVCELDAKGEAIAANGTATIDGRNYTVTYDATTTSTAPLQITNTLTGKVSIPVQKKWIGPAAQEAQVALLADGKKVAEATLDANTNWAHTFAEQPKYAADGHEITYKVQELTPENPTQGNSSFALVGITGDATNGFVLTNRNTSTRTISVTKVWKGWPGRAADFVLLRDGTVVPEETLHLTKAVKWTGIFDALPMYDPDDGHLYQYTVEEKRLSGYTTKMEGNMDDGFLFTNRRIPSLSSESEQSTSSASTSQSSAFESSVSTSVSSTTEQPPIPTTPSTPEEPPCSGNPSMPTPNTREKTTAPKTGDVLASLSMVAMVGTVAMLFGAGCFMQKSRRKSYRQKSNGHH